MFGNGDRIIAGRTKSQCLRFGWPLVLFLSLIYSSQARAQQESSSLQVVSPTNGSIVAAGQDIMVVVQIAEGASFAAIQVVGENLGISEAKTAPPFEFSVHIPRHLIGPKKIRAFGRTGPESGVFSAAVTINIEPSATPTALTVSPPQVPFERLGEQAGLTVTGTFDDGTVRDLTESSQTTFTSNDPSVATVDSSGVVTAVGTLPPGATEITTEIIVTYGNRSAVVPVTFRPADNVSIDIKPGSFPNSINLGSSGTVPVAILSTPSFDATTVDPLTVTLASASVKLKGKGTPQASSEDVNGDGRMDLVVHVETEALQLSSTSTRAVLEGKTFAGDQVRGSDFVNIVP